MASCIANVVWLFFWHYNVFALTLPMMIVLLLSLVATYLGLGVGETKVRRQSGGLHT